MQNLDTEFLRLVAFGVFMAGYVGSFTYAGALLVRSRFSLILLRATGAECEALRLRREFVLLEGRNECKDPSILPTAS